MNIDYSMVLESVSVIDQQDTLTDVVKRVVWRVSFFDTANPDITTDGTVETYLNTDSIAPDSFSDYQDLTHTQILQWALDEQGGASFLDHLLEGGHAAMLEKLIADSVFTEKDIELIPES